MSMEYQDHLSLKLKTNPFQQGASWKKFLFSLKDNILSYNNDSGIVIASMDVDKGIFQIKERILLILTKSFVKILK